MVSVTLPSILTAHSIISITGPCVQHQLLHHGLRNEKTNCLHFSPKTALPPRSRAAVSPHHAAIIVIFVSCEQTHEAPKVEAVENLHASSAKQPQAGLEKQTML